MTVSRSACVMLARALAGLAAALASPHRSAPHRPFPSRRPRQWRARLLRSTRGGQRRERGPHGQPGLHRGLRRRDRDRQRLVRRIRGAHAARDSRSHRKTARDPHSHVADGRGDFRRNRLSAARRIQVLAPTRPRHGLSPSAASAASRAAPPRSARRSWPGPACRVRSGSSTAPKLRGRRPATRAPR